MLRVALFFASTSYKNIDILKATRPGAPPHLPVTILTDMVFLLYVNPIS
jgi:hypothetical protein